MRKFPAMRAGGMRAGGVRARRIIAACIVLVGGLAAAGAWAQGSAPRDSASPGTLQKYQPIVRAMHASVYRSGMPSTIRTTFCLYVPPRDPSMGDGPGLGLRDLVLVHVAPQVAARMTLNARKRWYETWFNGPFGGGSFQPLLDADLWKQLPPLLRNIIAAFGLDDSDLILISDHLDSGAVSIYFRPEHDEDMDYYQHKLDVLLAYIQAHDMDLALPLAQVLPTDGTT